MCFVSKTHANRGYEKRPKAAKNWTFQNASKKIKKIIFFYNEIYI